jgi:hypothetical protein
VRAASNSTRTRSSGGGQAGGGQARRARPAGAGSRDGAKARIDRDALLQTLFPRGIPAREDVIRDASRWLDEAERLARTR